MISAPRKAGAPGDLPVARELRDLKAQTATAAHEKVALFDLLVGLLLDDSAADNKGPHARVGNKGARALGRET